MSPLPTVFVELMNMSATPSWSVSICTWCVVVLYVTSAAVTPGRPVRSILSAPVWKSVIVSVDPSLAKTNSHCRRLHRRVRTSSPPWPSILLAASLPTIRSLPCRQRRFRSSYRKRWRSSRNSPCRCPKRRYQSDRGRIARPWASQPRLIAPSCSPYSLPREDLSELQIGAVDRRPSCAWVSVTSPIELNSPGFRLRYCEECEARQVDRVLPAGVVKGVKRQGVLVEVIQGVAGVRMEPVGRVAHAGRRVGAIDRLDRKMSWSIGPAGCCRRMRRRSNASRLARRRRSRAPKYDMIVYSGLS